MSIIFTNLDPINDNSVEIDLENKILVFQGFFSGVTENCDGLDLLALTLSDISVLIEDSNGKLVYKVMNGFRATANDLITNCISSNAASRAAKEKSIKYFASVIVKNRWAPEYARYSGVVSLKPFSKAPSDQDSQELETQITEALGVADKLKEYRKASKNTDGFEILVLTPLPME